MHCCRVRERVFSVLFDSDAEAADASGLDDEECATILYRGGNDVWRGVDYIVGLLDWPISQLIEFRCFSFYRQM